MASAALLFGLCVVSFYATAKFGNESILNENLKKFLVLIVSFSGIAWAAMRKIFANRKE